LDIIIIITTMQQEQAISLQQITTHHMAAGSGQKSATQSHRNTTYITKLSFSTVTFRTAGSGHQTIRFTGQSANWCCNRETINLTVPTTTHHTPTSFTLLAAHTMDSFEDLV
jgi:hypothetical protein